jgi:hypothetical protein
MHECCIFQGVSTYNNKLYMQWCRTEKETKGGGGGGLFKGAGGQDVEGTCNMMNMESLIFQLVFLKKGLNMK